MMVKKALQIHTDDLHVCESNLVKYKSLNSVTYLRIFFYQMYILEINSPFNPSSLTSPKTRLPKSTINSQISILLHFKKGTCLHLNMAM